MTDECFSNFIGFNRKRGALGYRTFSSDLHFHTNVSRGSLVGRTRARTHQSSSRSLLSKRSESSQILWPRLPTQAKPTRDKGGLRASIAASCCAARHMDIYGTAHPPVQPTDAISTVLSRPCEEDSGNATHEARAAWRPANHARVVNHVTARFESVSVYATTIGELIAQ